MAMTSYATQLIGKPSGAIPPALDDLLARAKIEIATITGEGPATPSFTAFDPTVVVPIFIGQSDSLPDDWTLTATFDALNNRVVVDCPAEVRWTVLLMFQKYTAD